MSELPWVCLGSAIGGGARYLVFLALLRALGPAFPYGTLAVNLLGSFLIAVIAYAGAEAGLLSTTTRVALAAGVLGGFTTYSSFSLETFRALQAGDLRLAAVYVGTTVIGCLAATGLGWALAARLWPAQS